MRVVGSVPLVFALVALLAVSPQARGQPTQWTQVQWSGPFVRTSHTMGYDSARQVVVLFGGRSRTPSTYGDTWEWDGTHWSPRATTGPISQYGHAMCYDSARARTVLHGEGGQTWEWDGASWSLASSSGPPRVFAAIAYDAARSQTVLFGGYSGTTQNTIALSGQTWTWNGTTWTLRSSSGPAPMSGASMVYDSARQVCVLFGGYTGVNPLFVSDQTWEWNGLNWIQRSPPGPVPRRRESFAMAYDSARAVTVLYGGRTPFAVPSEDNSDTWEYDGTQWTQLGATDLPARSSMPMAYDAARSRMILFSGNTMPPGVEYTNSPVQGDTWALQGPCDPPVITQQPLTQWTCAGGFITFNIGVNGPGPFTYQWRLDGQAETAVVLPETGPSLTVQTDIAPFGGSSNRGYDCVISNSCGSVRTNFVYAAGCYLDFDCTSRIDVQDIFAFLAAWFAGDMRADAFTDGVLSVQDIFRFINYYFSRSC